MDLKRLKELIDIMRGTEVVEVELEEEGIRIRVKRGDLTAPPVPPKAAKQGALSGAEVQDPSESPDSLAEEQKLLIVPSPIVGTFYRSASPDSQPYVEVGDQIKKGQVLCIVEAMKLMNEIEAESEGRVVEICVEDNAPVEFGQPLFKVEPLQGPV